jgi:hypothetical protein
MIDEFILWSAEPPKGLIVNNSVIYENGVTPL